LALALLLSGCSVPTTSSGAQQASVPGYRAVRDVRLPGDTSRWDYQVYDHASHRLYISHLGASQIVVFDTAQQTVVDIVKDVAGVHGLALVPDLGRLFASATDQNRVVAIDLSTLKVVGRASTGSYPDGVAYAPEAHSVFVSNEHGSGDSVIDARSSEYLGEIELGGDIGNSQYDPARKVIYVAVGSRNELVTVDSTQRTVVDRSGLDGCSGAHGVQVDTTARHRVFVACEGNAALVVFDLVAKRVTQTFDVGKARMSSPRTRPRQLSRLVSCHLSWNFTFVL
jgi:DNA-binding beta-propeller fold protein YncE